MAETVPGGYYLGPNGEPHDANGKPVKKISDAKVREHKAKGGQLTEAQIAARAEAHAAEQRRLEAEEAAEAAAAASKDAGQAVKQSDKDAKADAKNLTQMERDAIAAKERQAKEDEKAQKELDRRGRR